uniref:Uncharacterized protein n=1 Tax=Chrysemys picta bellii TaxID=8478 RepID=A0A8C3FP37_CHRPI
MATAPSGPRRIRTNPFSSSSSSFCSKAEGRASASLCCCCGGELAWLLDSLSRSWADTHSTAGISAIPLLGRGTRSLGLILGAPRPFPAGLTRSVSTSRRVWLSCFSSSAILAIDSFSASWSFSVSCKRNHGTWPPTVTGGRKGCCKQLFPALSRWKTQPSLHITRAPNTQAAARYGWFGGWGR